MTAALIFLGTMALGVFFTLVIVGMYLVARFILPRWTAPITITVCVLVWAYVLL